MIQNRNVTPFLQMVYLLLLVFAGLMLASVFSFGISHVVWGNSLPTAQEELMRHLGFLRLSQILQSFLGLFAPALVFLHFFDREDRDQLFRFPSSKILLLLSVFIMICSLPLIEASSWMNQNIPFPSNLRSAQEWMEREENHIKSITLLFLETDHFPTILFNFFMMAVLPAFSEELFFRGVIQNRLTRFWNNGHLAIIFTALIFSAVHFQFLTFFPRVILGMFLGYLLYWGKSLWLPVLAHLVNNTMALTIYYYMRRNHPDVDPLATNSEMVHPAAVGFSLLLVIVLMVLLKKWGQGPEVSENTK